MILKKIQIENFRSYENQEISFPRGSTLLSGDIGSGKTSVLLAIEFALFGLQPSQKGSSLLRNQSNNARVMLEFEVDGHDVVIERTLKRTKTISQDSASIMIDGEQFAGSVSEIKNKVLKLLNYPGEFAKKTNLLYKYTVYTPQEEMKQIILESKDVRLNILRHVFGVDKYKLIEENSLLLTAKLREKIRLNQGMLYDFENDKKLLETRKENLKKLKERQKKGIIEYETAIKTREEKEKLVHDIEEKINEKRAFETEFEKSKVLIFEKNQNIKILDANINSLKMQIQEVKKIPFNFQEYKSLDDRILFQDNKYEELQKEYLQIIGTINSQDLKKKESLELKEKISGLKKCPTCLQDISSQYKANIFAKVDEELSWVEKRKNEFEERKNQLSKELDEIKKRKEDFKKQKSELELIKIKHDNLKEKEERILEIETQKQGILKDIEMLQEHVDNLKKSLEEYSKYNDLFKKREEELKSAKELENRFAIRKAEINKEVQFLEQQIKETQEQIAKKQKIKENTDKLREIEYWISEKFLDLVLFTEKQVLLKLKQEFSNLFSKWFSILVSENLSAKLNDNFSPVIEQQDYELDYDFLSGGERTAVALAYRLSLNQVINSVLSKIKTSNLIILDEPTDGFSSE